MIDEGHSQSDKPSRAKEPSASTSPHLLPTLNAIIRSVEGLKEIKKRDLAPGDRVVVRTRNSPKLGTISQVQIVALLEA